MNFKECYVSSNGISCITNINTLHNIKINNPLKTNQNINIKNFINKHNIIFFLALRLSEFIISDFISNRFYLFNITNDENSNINTNYLINNIMFT